MLAALGADDPEPVRSQGFSAGDVPARRSAARLAARRRAPADTGTLLVLAHDPEPAVRASAARGLVRCVAVADTDGAGDVLAALVGCAVDPGTDVAHTLADELRGANGMPLEVAAPVLDILRDHVSASARQSV